MFGLMPLLFLFPDLFISSQTSNNDNVISIDARRLQDNVIPNIVDNINVWNMGKQFLNPQIEFTEYSPFKFVKWVQFMQCTGGSVERDLFVDPKDRSTLTDYKFEPLIKNCEGVLSLGAKPHLKLGNVPLKLTTDPKIGTFGVNVYPPDSYQQYYDYIKSIATALVEHFGKEEVSTWRFGCMTEFENRDWFMAKSGKPEDSFVEYCKLYDYTVQALIDAIGEDVCVGAHCMAVSEGLWDEKKFIEHVAKGKNWATGNTGTRICFLAASYYDSKPGNIKQEHLPVTIKTLKDAAESNGLTNLFYGVDEGRIHSGLSQGRDGRELLSRACGYSWQGAYDAHIFFQAIDCGLDYFSTWGYLSNGIMGGFPSVSYHIANNISKFSGYNKVVLDSPYIFYRDDEEIGCLAGVKGDTIRIMLFNLLTKEVVGKGEESIEVRVYLPFKSRKVSIVKKVVDDNCNFFDEWKEICRVNKIPNTSFAWSPDDPHIDSSVSSLSNPSDKKKYITDNREYLKDCTNLVPTTLSVKVKNRILETKLNLKGNTVTFLEITK